MSEEDIKKIEENLKEEIESLRDDIKTETNAIYDTLKSDEESIKSDLREKIKEIKSEIQMSQRDLLRSMISIFGIFVAIFSFVVISTNTVLEVQLLEEDFSFWEIFFRVSALLLPIFLFLILLLIISVLLTRK
jgi:hypothetical protein